jgi:FixJ family two-component response regulator
MTLKVFYLDDELLLCSLFSEEYSSKEIQVTTFSDYLKFIDETKINPPDVIFLDYRLPGITGDQVALKIANEIPKYLITGDLHVKPSYNFEGIIQKPYEEADIHNILQNFLKIKKK